MVRFDQLSKSFGGITAVYPLDLTVGRGEFITLLGPSGCGKTTTLMLVAGFERPSSGEIFLGEKRVTDTPANQRDVGIVFQQYALFPHFNVYGNIAFPLKVRKLPAGEIERRIGEILEVVRLEELRGRFPRELSGGQQQRVALARALVYRPSILLMDEPLAALDRKLREDMQLEIKRIHREFGITTIYVTHDQQEALTMSDRIVVMNQGRIEQCGRPHEVYERPNSSFVAKFLGDANLFNGELIVIDGGSLSMRLEGGKRITLRRRDAPVPKGGVSIVVRPEKMIILGAQPKNGNWLAGTIRDVVYQGELTRVYVDTPGQKTIMVTEANSTWSGVERKGGDVWVSWSEEDTILVRE